MPSVNQCGQNPGFRQWLIVDAVLEEFERTYHLLLHCFPDISHLVEPVARIQEIQRVLFVLFK